MIKVIDVFAGPGGLGEGFSSLTDSEGRNIFTVSLSIEKDPLAHSTLKLRTFYREIKKKDTRDLADYYSFLRQEISLQELYNRHPAEAEIADNRAWRAELGSPECSAAEVRDRIGQALKGTKDFVLIGGPPCQVYSIAGRSRIKGIKGYNPERKRKQRLYVEYLQILADHEPAVFLMENVKGLLSAKFRDHSIFQKILEGLQQPALALNRENRGIYRAGKGYRLFSFVESGDTPLHPKDFLIRAENYGIPQSRHRVIVLGLREDLVQTMPRTLRKQPQISLKDVIFSMPKLRSGLSNGNDDPKEWLLTLNGMAKKGWLNGGARQAGGSTLVAALLQASRFLQVPKHGRGGQFVKCSGHEPEYRPEWFLDNNLGGVCNHETRCHIEEDLCRYFYASCFAAVHGHSPKLKEFPKKLLPNHRNVRLLVKETRSTVAAKKRLANSSFDDRFRVQLWNKPATTITSHIARDGHYYIHPQPMQCRSLTVREAARIQTFPDNYFFCGPRTFQYQQVGNAVPPLLAIQLAGIVYDAMMQAGVITRGEMDSEISDNERRAGCLLP